MAQIYRFRDAVALTLGDGPTRYYTPEEARTLAKALMAGARDVDARPFKESAFPSTDLYSLGEDLAINIPRVERGNVPD